VRAEGAGKGWLADRSIQSQAVAIARAWQTARILAGDTIPTNNSSWIACSRKAMSFSRKMFPLDAVLVWPRDVDGPATVGERLRLQRPRGPRGECEAGIGFQVYEAERITLVFWLEGEVLCMLAGDGDREALVQLAFAKAM
jgi:hypothetical protein